jgi:arsenite-transporting ATPase
VRLILYTGKGGVGKTTTAAATAACAAARGLRTLVISADAAHSLGDVFDQRLGSDPVQIGACERLHAVEVDARAEMERHWGRVREYLVALFRYQGIEEVVAEELALLPGVEELTALLAVERFSRSRRYELVVVDCAPTDSTLRLVTLPDVAHGAMRILLRVQRAVSSVVIPIARNVVPLPLPGVEVFRDAEHLFYNRLRALRRRLGADSTSVRIVLTSERMVIDEARRAYTDLCLFDIACDAVVMNRLLPERAAREPFFREMAARQDERRAEIGAHFDPLPVLGAPLAEDEVTGLAALTEHGENLFGVLDPAARLCAAPRIRFEHAHGTYAAHLPLPGVAPDALDVAKVDDELVITTGTRRRALKLPRRLARLPLAEARLEGQELHVFFDDASEPAS